MKTRLDKPKGRKLTFEQATIIRLSLRLGNAPHVVARVFNLTPTTVSMIRNYHWWKENK